MYVNLIVDLDDSRFSPARIHDELVQLDARALRPLREHRTPERLLGWIDATFGGAWSSEAAAGGTWIVEGPSGPVGFAAYAPRGLRYHWLRAWDACEDVGTFGPMGVEPRIQGSGVGRVLLHAALFSLRELGYRRALIPVVGEERVAFYERNAGARLAEEVDLGRGGRRWRTLVLSSGNGTNFEGVCEAAASGAAPLDVIGLVTNKPSAFVLQRAARVGVPATVLSFRRGEESRERYDARLTETIAAHEPDLVLLLGWMHVFSASVVARFGNMLNLHPAFLPLAPEDDAATMPDGTRLTALRGAHAFDDALRLKSKWAGASVHRVEVAVDRGPVLARLPLQLRDGEPRAALDERLHALERRVVTAAVRRWSWEQP